MAGGQVTHTKSQDTCAMSRFNLTTIVVILASFVVASFFFASTSLCFVASYSDSNSILSRDLVVAVAMPMMPVNANNECATCIWNVKMCLMERSDDFLFATHTIKEQSVLSFSSVM